MSHLDFKKDLGDCYPNNVTLSRASLVARGLVRAGYPLVGCSTRLTGFVCKQTFNLLRFRSRMRVNGPSDMS